MLAVGSGNQVICRRTQSAGEGVIDSRIILEIRAETQALACRVSRYKWSNRRNGQGNIRRTEGVVLRVGIIAAAQA